MKFGKREVYGKELILDLHRCDTGKFNRKDLRYFFKQICKLVDMKKCKCTFWDDVGVAKEERQTLPHTKGTSAVQFILTSSIVVHTLDDLGKVFVNLFSCKTFDSEIVKSFTADFFKGKIVQSNCIGRF